MKTPDLSAFERKIRRGKTLEQAAEEAGVDIDTARSYLERRRESAAKVGDDVLELNAAEAIYYGMKTLIAACKEKNRTIRKEEKFGTERAGVEVQTQAVIDVESARTLLSFGLNAKKLIYGKSRGVNGKDPPDGQEDLFDGAEGSLGNWVFRRIR